MDRIVSKIRFWDPKSDNVPTLTSGKDEQLSARIACVDETIDYTAYHICAFDPVLSVLLLVGDNVPVVVLAPHRRRVTLPVRKGARWLDCHIFAGTSSFLLLSPEALLLMDYAQRCPSSGLFARGGEKMFFSCLHVPQGLTWGAVGGRNGNVMYWKLAAERNEFGKIAWAALTTDVAQLCDPWISSSTSTPSIEKRVYCIDSYPTNPNALVAVLAGVPGVIKWYIDENRMSCFFALSEVAELAVCRVTPGGAYVTATTGDASSVFLWSSEGKRRGDRSVELLWALESGCLSRTMSMAKNKKKTKNDDESEQQDDDDDDDKNSDGDASDQSESINSERSACDWMTCGMHIARASGTRTHSDKKSHLIILLYTRAELTELVLDVDKKKLLQREDILSHVTVFQRQRTPPPELSPDAAISRIVPCVRSSYWHAAWTEKDFEALFVTSRGGAPRLVRRCCARRAVAGVAELTDIPGGAQWGERLPLLALPAPVVAALLRDTAAEEGPDERDPWEAALRRPEGRKEAEGQKVSSMDLDHALVGVMPSTSAAVALLPFSNETIFISPAAVKRQMLCSGSSGGITILEEVLPALPQRSEFIIRAKADTNGVTVWITYLLFPKVEQLVVIPRAYLLPDENESNGYVAWSAVLVDCRIRQAGTPSARNQVLRGGKSILIQLCDASLILVDLSGGAISEDGFPLVLRLPAALFPAGTTIASFDTAWVHFEREMKLDRSGKAEEGSEFCLMLFCVLSGQSGVVVWDICRMRLIAYIPQQEIDWRWDTVRVTRNASRFVTGAHKDTCDEFVFSIDSAVTVPPAGREGRLFPRDALGRRLFTIRLVYNNCSECDGWSVAFADEASNGDWCLLGHAVANATAVHFFIKIVKDAVVVGIFGGAEREIGEAPYPECRVCAVDFDDEWPFRLLGSHKPTKQEMVLFCNDVEVGFFRAEKLAWGKSTKQVPLATFRCDIGRSIECVSLCESLRAVLILTKDSNNWRWLALLQLDTAEHMMSPAIMVYYTTEEQLSLHVAPDDWGNKFHVYVLGAKVLGHIVLSPIGDNNDVDNLSASPQPHILSFIDEPVRAVPVGFRLYQRFLPLPPTMKQEQGFFKRLMTLPWEEVALKLESEVLMKERNESFKEFEQRIASHERKALPNLRGPGQEQDLPQKNNTAQESEKLFSSGSRYKELKETAARENVTLQDARRIMSDNRLRLEERGERISQIQNKSRELADQAAIFQNLSKKLKEKQRDKWF